jgi:hypothetical protein
VKKNFIAAIALSMVSGVTGLYAGNPERQGQAGAAQLTINGWARSSGWGWANGGGVSGVEAMYMNAAGLDRSATKTELAFNRTQWLVGSGIAINNFAFSQKMGEDGDKGTFGVSVMQFGIKPIEITTESNPYGGIGTYRVNMTNIGLAYSKSFSNNVSAGVVVRAVNEGIPDARAMGMSLDAGVQYTTTLRPTSNKMKQNDIKFGVSMKNIGPDMRHQGDGLSYKATLQNGTFSKTVQPKVDKIKMPSLLNISGSYDIRLDKSADAYNNKLTVGFGFTNYAFSANQTTLGLEYTYKQFISVRGGFVYQEGVFDSENRTSAFTGLSGGLSYDIKTKGNVVSLDYSYRATNPFDGTHSFGLRIGLGGGEE